MKLTNFEISSTDPELLAFAASFDHKPDPQLRTIVIKNEETGEWLGYVQVFPVLPTITAWKRPGVDTIKAIKYTKNLLTEAGGGFMLTACSKESPFYDKMDRLGFTSSGLELFYNTP